MPTASLARRLLVLNGILLIGICIFLFSSGLGGLIADFNPCTALGALIFELPALCAGIAVYLSVFRQKAAMARGLGILFQVLSGFVALGAVGAVIEWIWESPAWDTNFFLFVCQAILFAVYLFFSGRQQLRWNQTIQAIESESWVLDAGEIVENNGLRNIQEAEIVRRPFQYSLGDLLGLVTVVAAIIGFTIWTICDYPPPFIEHATPEQAKLALPAGARDVCCRRGIRGCITYEFSIDEKGFFEWANSSTGTLESNAAGIPIEPVSGEFSIYRYAYFSHTGSASSDTARIVNGYCYHWSKEDRWVKFAYDKDTGRAYYNFNSY
jgi:hypothetical protein